VKGNPAPPLGGGREGMKGITKTSVPLPKNIMGMEKFLKIPTPPLWGGGVGMKELVKENPAPPLRVGREGMGIMEFTFIYPFANRPVTTVIFIFLLR